MIIKVKLKIMKNKTVIQVVYHIEADKLITFDNFDEMILTLLFIKAEPT